MDGHRARLQGMRQTALTRTTLPVAGAFLNSSEIIVQGFTNVLIYGDYEQAEADGELDIAVQWSPWTEAEVPAGDIEWYPLTILSTPAATGGAVAVSILEPNVVRFVPDVLTATPFTLHLTVGNFVERLRVRVRDNSKIGPGDAAVYAVISDEADGAWGLTLPGASPTVTGLEVDANLMVDGADVDETNPVPTLPVLPDTIIHDVLTAAAADTAYPLAGVATPLTGGQVAIKALSTNTDVVVIGGSAVTLADGIRWRLAVPILIDDLSATVYYRATIINRRHNVHHWLGGYGSVLYGRI